MKNEISENEIIKQYIEICLIIHKANLNGDYKTSNKEGKKIIKLFKYLEKNIEVAKRVLPILFKHENVCVRIEGAAQCLSLKIFVDEAEKVLEIDLLIKEHGFIYRNEAEQTLKQWREKGYLKIYPEQQIS